MKQSYNPPCVTGPLWRWMRQLTCRCLNNPHPAYKWKTQSQWQGQVARGWLLNALKCPGQLSLSSRGQMWISPGPSGPGLSWASKGGGYWLAFWKHLRGVRAHSLLSAALFSMKIGLASDGVSTASQEVPCKPKLYCPLGTSAQQSSSNPYSGSHSSRLALVHCRLQALGLVQVPLFILNSAQFLRPPSLLLGLS